MAAVPWNSNSHSGLGVKPFIMLGTMLSEEASFSPQISVKLVVLHNV